MDAKATGLLISEQRKEKGLSQSELAEQIHVTDKAISRWETGRGLPGADSLEALAEALDLTVGELLSGAKLTPEEQPKATGTVLVETIRKNRRMLIKGALLTIAVILVLSVTGTGLWAWYHHATSVDGNNLTLLALAAGEVLSEYIERNNENDEEYRIEVMSPEGLWIVEREEQDNYMAALLLNDAGEWGMCVYDRDPVFPNRWRVGGGVPLLESGELGAWGYGHGGDSVSVICGGDLPEEAAYYYFHLDGTAYIRPMDERTLDLFVIRSSAIGPIPAMLDKDLRPIKQQVYDMPLEETLNNLYEFAIKK